MERAITIIIILLLSIGLMSVPTIAESPQEVQPYVIVEVMYIIDGQGYVDYIFFDTDTQVVQVSRIINAGSPHPLLYSFIVNKNLTTTNHCIVYLSEEELNSYFVDDITIISVEVKQ